MFNANFSASSPKDRKQKPKSSLQVSGITIMFTTIIDRLDKVEAKVDRFEERLSFF